MGQRTSGEMGVSHSRAGRGQPCQQEINGGPAHPVTATHQPGLWANRWSCLIPLPALTLSLPLFLGHCIFKLIVTAITVSHLASLIKTVMTSLPLHHLFSTCFPSHHLLHTYFPAILPHKYSCGLTHVLYYSTDEDLSMDWNVLSTILNVFLLWSAPKIPSLSTILCSNIISGELHMV